MKRYVFDLDNTLIYTNTLNNNSYNYALFRLGLNPITDCIRITRSMVFNKYADISQMKKKRIIQLKQEYFVRNLQVTIPNKSLMRILSEQNNAACILWTSAEKIRVEALLDYYKIATSFKKIIYSTKRDLEKDINVICETLACQPLDLNFYEDEWSVIQNLLECKLRVRCPNNQSYENSVCLRKHRLLSI